MMFQGMAQDVVEVLDRKMLAEANINPDTGLATDYLNHYNEVAMLIDMLESMPDVVEDILEWRPITYAEHFHVTGFRAKDLAAAAFEQADPEIRSRFDAACRHVEEGLKAVQILLSCEPPQIEKAVLFSSDIYDRIATVSGVINPHVVHDDAADADVWDLSEQTVADEQAAIDALFD